MMITIQSKFTTLGVIAWSTNGLVAIGHIASGRQIQFDSMKEFKRAIREITGWSNYQINRLLFNTFILNRSQSPQTVRLLKELILRKVIEA
jgi:hypothetical protein